MKGSVCSLLFLFFITQLYAQKRFDLFYVGANENFMQQDSIKRDKNYEASAFANLSVPIILKDSSVWITVFDYQSYSINNNYFSTDSMPIDRFNLHAFILRTGYIRRFSEGRALQVLVIPRVMTDFNTAFSKSFQMGGMMMYEKVKSKTYTYRIGILYNQECFGPYITPIFYLDWSITQKLKFTGLLPIYGKLYLEPSTKLSYGLHFVGLTTSYRVNENNYENYYVERNSIDLSVFSNIKIWKNVYFEGRVGYSIKKDYALYAEDQKVDLGLPLIYIGDNRTRSNYEYENSPFVHFRLLYSLPIN